MPEQHTPELPDLYGIGALAVNCSYPLFFYMPTEERGQFEFNSCYDKIRLYLQGKTKTLEVDYSYYYKIQILIIMHVYTAKGYKSNIYLWEIVIIIRKVTAAVILTYFDGRPQFQAICMVNLLFISYILTAAYKPFMEVDKDVGNDVNVQSCTPVPSTSSFPSTPNSPNASTMMGSNRPLAKCQQCKHTFMRKLTHVNLNGSVNSSCVI